MPLTDPWLIDDPPDVATNPLLADWAHVHAARAVARAAGCWSGLVYLRTWPPALTIERRPACAFTPPGAPEPEENSPHDLRDGLCVIEVFATGDPSAAETPSGA